MFGHSGRMVHIDLGEQKFFIEKFDDRMAKKSLAAAVA